jgi:hypothetical protein
MANGSMPIRITLGITKSERLINHFKNAISRTSVHAFVRRCGTGEKYDDRKF